MFFVKLFHLYQTRNFVRRGIGILLASLFYSIRCNSLFIVYIYHQKSEKAINHFRKPEILDRVMELSMKVSRLKKIQVIANMA